MHMSEASVHGLPSQSGIRRAHVHACMLLSCMAGPVNRKLLQETKDGFLLEPPPDGIDRRTAAEKRYDEMMAKREVEQSKKAAMKSHRERVNEFNTYLQNLSEHHDIPRRAHAYCDVTERVLNCCAPSEALGCCADIPTRVHACNDLAERVLDCFAPSGALCCCARMGGLHLYSSYSVT